MVKHYIIMSSAFTLGTRIALHYIIKEDKDIEKVKEDVKYIEEHSINDIHLSSHSISTESEDWDSIVEKDAFFKNVKVIKEIDEFVSYIDQDADLRGIDVAKYILSIMPCTHLKLEKLVYMAYADYLVKTGKHLFEDKIYAYKLGPVVKSVYAKYKKEKYFLIFDQEDSKEVVEESKIQLPIRSRIMASKDGSKKIFSILDTLEKYGLMDAFDLVKLTHRDKSPWSETGGLKVGPYTVISDDKILKYHVNEVDL